MVCQRCVLVVKNLLKQQGHSILHIDLGKVTLNSELNDKQLKTVQKDLQEYGFELLSNENQIIISTIKSLILKAVYEDEFLNNKNLSDILKENLNKDYSILSKLFSEIEGLTIEKYKQKLKIERIKELLIYDELSVSEIAAKMNYSSVAYLSNQFKKETGLTPSFFKKMKLPPRKPLDSI